MDLFLSRAREKQNEIVLFLKELVECESPSDDRLAVNRFVDLFAASVADIAKVRTFPGGPFGRHLQCRFMLPGARKSPQILALGHSDTVWPLGTLNAMPWRRAKGRLWGPGVLDMKSGLAFFVFAMRILRDLEVLVPRPVVLQINSDEEVGSDSSRPLTEREARRSAAVLVLEPGTGLEGKAKTARKGVGSYKLAVSGKSSHAGVDFAAGASAIDELASQIEKIRRFSQLKRGVTVNVGLISGGTRTNVVAASASAEIDFRVPKLADYKVLQKKLLALRPRDPRCRLQLSGGLNRPPMERSKSVVALFREARKLAAEIDVDLEESATGGGSDGNFTAALGIPTLDGIGGVGEGAHAIHESILENRIVDRVALLAKLVKSI